MQTRSALSWAVWMQVPVSLKAREGDLLQLSLGDGTIDLVGKAMVLQAVNKRLRARATVGTDNKKQYLRSLRIEDPVDKRVSIYECKDGSIVVLGEK